MKSPDKEILAQIEQLLRATRLRDKLSSQISELTSTLSHYTPLDKGAVVAAKCYVRTSPKGHVAYPNCPKGTQFIPNSSSFILPGGEPAFAFRGGQVLKNGTSSVDPKRQCLGVVYVKDIEGWEV